MNKQDAIKELNELNKTAARLRAIIDKPEQVRRWQPTSGEIYYHIDDIGTAWRSICENGEINQVLLAMGNCYRTKVEALQIIENRKTHVELQDIADQAWADTGKPFDRDDFALVGYSIIYIQSDNRVAPYYAWGYRKACQVYFPCEETTEAAIEAVGKERVKAYIKGGLV